MTGLVMNREKELDMSELTAEEQALLAAQDDKPRRGRPPRRPEPVVEPPADTCDRGPHTPVQFDDDGWADLPVQMRG